MTANSKIGTHRLTRSTNSTRGTSEASETLRRNTVDSEFINMIWLAETVGLNN